LPSVERKGDVAEFRVEAPTADLAQALMSRLHGFYSELSEAEGSCQVSISLAGDPDRAVVEVLNVVDRWLVTHELSEVEVRLWGRTYTLTPPPHAPGALGERERPARQGRAGYDRAPERGGGGGDRGFEPSRPA
jgi:hypothetical protein